MLEFLPWVKKEVINIRQHWRLVRLPATPSTVSRYCIQESSGNRAIKMDRLNVEVWVTMTTLSILNDPHNKKSILRNAIRNPSSLHFESILFLAFHHYCGFLFRATTKIKHILMYLFEEPTSRLRPAALSHCARSRSPVFVSGAQHTWPPRVGLLLPPPHHCSVAML